MGSQARWPAQSYDLGAPAEGAARCRYAAALILFFLISFIGGAVLTPWAYVTIAQVAGWLGIPVDPFPRYIPRVIPIVALLTIRPLTRWAGFHSPADVGVVVPHAQWPKFLFGFVTSLIALTLLSAIVLNSGAVALRDGITLTAILDKLAVAVFSAFAVAVIEEIIYRGVILSLLARVLAWPTALVLSSVIFTLMHFMHRPLYDGPIAWNSGLLLLPDMLAGWLDFRNMGASAVSLFFTGTLIGIAYGHTRNLYCSIGLHAGAIVASKLFLGFTVVTPGAAIWFWSSGHLIDGWVTVIALGLGVALFALNSSRKQRLVEVRAGGMAEGTAFDRSIQAVLLIYLALLACAVLVSFVIVRLWQ